MGLLPWGLSRILGISVYLDIPADTAWWVAIAGLVLVVVGAILVVVGGLGRRSARAAGSRLRAGQRFWPMSQSRSGRPSIASETASA